MFDENVKGFSKNVSLELELDTLVSNSFSNTSIVAESSIESNDSVNERLNNIEFMVFSPRHSPGVTEKAELKKMINNKTTKKNSAKILKGIDELQRICDEGYVHTLNLQLSDEGGDGEHHIICIDHDYKEGDAHIIPLESMRQLPTIKRYAALIQPSLSYTEKTPNCHVYFPLSRAVTTKEQQLIIQVIFDWNRKDIEEALGITADPNNAKVGGDRCFKNNAYNDIFAPADKMARFLDPEAILDVEDLLQEAKEKGYTTSKNTGRKTKVTQTSPVSDSKVTLPKIESVTTAPPESVSQPQTITEAVLKHLHDHLLIGKMNGDARLLYSLHGDKLYFTPRDPEQGEVCRYATSNPFSSTNKSGESFMIIHEEGMLPRFWDKSGEFDTRHQDGYSSNHGTYLDYYFHVMAAKLGKFIGIERQSDGSYPKGFFKVLVEDIITTYGLPEFDWNCLDIELETLKDIILDHFVGKLYYLGNDTFFYFNGYKWEIVGDQRVVHGFIIDKFIKDNYTGRTIYQIKGKKRVVITSDSPLLHGVIKTMTYRNEYQRSPDAIPMENLNYVPFMNGLYDLKKDELIENDGRAYNRHVIPWNYAPESKETIKAVEYLKNYLVDLLQCQVSADLIFTWIMLNCQRKAVETMKCIAIFGASGKGKTTILYIIRKLLNGLLNDEDEDPKTKSLRLHGYAFQPPKTISSDSHISASFESCTSILIPDLGNVVGQEIEILSYLKDYLGNKDARIFNVNAKFQAIRRVYHNFAFTLDCENIPKMTSEIEGYFRRTVFVKMPKHSPGCDDFHAERMGQIENTLGLIFNYAIKLDTQELLKQFKELKEHEIIKGNISDVRRDNDSVLDFINDYLQVTEDESDKCSWEVLHQLLMTTNNQYLSNKTKKRVLINALVQRLEDKMYNLGWKGESDGKPFRCRITKKLQRGYISHLKFTDDALTKMGLFDSSTAKSEDKF